MNGIDFPMDGPMMDGTWQNMQTGDIFTVKDSYFQDGQLIVQATDGRMLNYNILQNYVKVEKPVRIDKSQPSKKKQLPKEIESEIAPIDVDDTAILDDDIELIQGNIVDDTQEKAGKKAVLNNSITAVTKSDDEKMVERVLQRATSPKINHNIKWDKFPSRQMEMLIDFMGIDPTLIANYYIDKLDINSIKEMLSEQIIKYIDKELNDSAEPDTKEESKPKTKKKTV